MKKLILALFLPLFFLSSCIEDSETKFTMSGSSYLLQTTQKDGSYLFYPYVFVYSDNTEFSLSDVKIQSANKALPMSKLNDYQWVSQTTVDKPSDMNGTYYVTATNQKDDQLSSSITFEFDDKDILGDFKVDTFYYDRNALVATLSGIPENAKVLGFSINFFDSEVVEKPYGCSFYAIAGEYTTSAGKTITLADQLDENGKISFRLAFDTDSSSDMMYFHMCRVGIWASSAHAVYRISDETHVMAEAAQTF